METIGDDGKQEGKDQPLMLAQNQKIILKVRLAGRQIKGGRAQPRQDLDAPVGRHVARHEFVVSAIASSVVQFRENGDGGADTKSNFRGAKQPLPCFRSAAQ